MNARFDKEVSAFLETLNISMDTHIFEHMLYEMLGLKIGENDLRYSNIHFEESKQKFSLNLNSGLSLKELDVVLNYFEIPRDSFRTHDQFIIEPLIMFNKVVPEVLSYINRLSLGSPSKLKPYQIKSRPKLERDALLNVMEALTPLVMNTLTNPATNTGIRAEITSTATQLMLAAAGLGNEYRINEDATLGVMETIKIMQERLATIIANNSDLEKSDPEAYTTLTNTLEAYAVYARFNRTTATLAVTHFFNEIRDFTESHAISTAATDIFEETLLRLAGIQSSPSESHFRREHGDRSRIELEITGITPEEGLSLIEWFHANGDHSAALTNPRDEYHVATESAGRNYAEESSYTLKMNVDGEILNNNILPLFKDAITEMKLTQPVLLKSYQDKSFAHFTGKMKDDLKKLVKDIYRMISEEKLAPTSSTALLTNLQDRLKDLERSFDCKNPQDLIEAKHSLHEVWMIAAAKGGVTAVNDKFNDLLTQLNSYCERVAPVVALAVAEEAVVAEPAIIEPAEPATPPTSPADEASAPTENGANKPQVARTNLFERRKTLQALKDFGKVEMKVEATTPKM